MVLLQLLNIHVKLKGDLHVRKKRFVHSFVHGAKT